jgi:hypothetical protein
MLRSCLVVLFIVYASLDAQGQQVTDAELQSASILLRRENRCGMISTDRTDLQQCPVYSVTISGDGVVTYEGWAGVKTLGKRTHRINIESVRSLAEEFVRADFFSMRDRYEGLDLGDGTIRVVTHDDAVTIVLSIRGKTKSIYDFYGAPAILETLERRVDEVSQCSRYTGRSP